MSQIIPFLWFDDKAEEAVNFYVSIFKNAKIDNIRRYGDAGPGTSGAVMTIEFQLDGQDFMALNGGDAAGRAAEAPVPGSIALFVSCEEQAEVDVLWEKLSAGGAKGRCGWLTD